MMASLSSVPLPELVRTVLLESENPTYVFLRIPMPPEMAGDKPSNERFLQLKIPVAIIHASARRGRKWLLYVATAIMGTHGHLRQYGKDLQSEDMQGPVIENDCGDARTTSYAEGSRLHNKEAIHTRDGGRCVVLGPALVENEYGHRSDWRVGAGKHCQVAHILPHAKGNAYLDAVVQARGLSENIQFDDGIDDEKNALYMDGKIHEAGLMDQTCAFLYVPNSCMTMEDVLYPEEHLPPPLPGSLQHATEHTYLQFQMLETSTYFKLLDYMSTGRLWNNKFIRMPDDRSSFPPFFICHFHYGCTALHLWLDEESLSTLNRYNLQRYPSCVENHQRPEPTAPSPVQKSSDAAVFLVSWLWRANGVTMEEDGVNDPQTIINEEFTSDRRELMEKWCQETDLGRE
ncbi:hypothetical protein EDD85DRAFT_937394 [Armillaria nabsnona]|nr:hypothetical protein EDD85DRAFT_937394 [Armillaria nabsnona]